MFIANEIYAECNPRFKEAYHDEFYIIERRINIDYTSVIYDLFLAYCGC